MRMIKKFLFEFLSKFLYELVGRELQTGNNRQEFLAGYLFWREDGQTPF